MPWGCSPSGQDTRAHDLLFRPSHAALVVVGDVTPERVDASATRAFGDWPAAESQPEVRDAPPRRQGPRVSILPRSGRVQLIGAVFARGPAPASDDALACMVLTQLLGAGRSSALREHLRAEGDVYDVSAGLALDRTASVLSIAASFDQDRAVEGTGSILSAIRDVRAGKTTDDQVAIARETALSRWRLQLATVRGAAAAYALWLSLGLGPQALRELPARLAKVGREDVVRAAARYLQEGSLHVTYLGEDRWIDPRPLGMGGMATLDLPQ